MHRQKQENYTPSRFYFLRLLVRSSRTKKGRKLIYEIEYLHLQPRVRIEQQCSFYGTICDYWVD